MAVVAKARVVQLTGFRSISAAAEGSVTFRRCSFWRKARLCVSGAQVRLRGTAGGASPSPTRVPQRFRFCVGEALGPPASSAPGALVENTQAQKLNRTNSNFPKTQGPVARKKSQKATQILRAGNVLPTPRGNPRKWGPGKGDYEHEVLIRSRPRRRFGDFAAVGKVTRRPQAAKSRCHRRRNSIVAPSSVTASPCHLPPRGKA